MRVHALREPDSPARGHKESSFHLSTFHRFAYLLIIGLLKAHGCASISCVLSSVLKVRAWQSACVCFADI